jgi:putative flippase GtrA
LASQYRHELIRFLKFSAVGVLGTAIDLGLLNLLVRVAGWPLLAANSVSFSCAVLSNFTWNRVWTYPESRERPVRTQLPQFVLVNVIGLVMNNLVLMGFHRVFQHYVPDPYDYNLAKMCAIGIVLFWNFFANRLWTYRGL